MLIITGVGRCGTSMVAKFFENMGFNLGDVRWNPNVNAGGEDAIVVCINRWLYKCELLYGSTSHFLIKGGRHIANINLSVVKDPRFTWPGVMEGWLRVRRDLRVLFLTRDFNAVMDSRERMGKVSNDLKDPRKYTIERLRGDFTQCVKVLEKNNVRYTMLSFPGFLDEYDLFYQALVSLKCDFFKLEAGRKVWEKTVDKRLIHEKEKN